MFTTTPPGERAFAPASRGRFIITDADNLAAYTAE